MKKQIVCEKWFDCLRDSPEDYFPDFNEEPNESDGLYSFGNVKEDEEIVGELLDKSKTNIKVISTPFGLLPLSEFSFASKFFNFWVIHTNFPVSSSMILQISDINGIEDILPISKHRFRISVGRLFSVGTIFKELSDLLCGESDTEIEAKIYKQAEELKKSLQSYKYWAILVLPNGSMTSIKSNELTDEFEYEYNDYKETYQAVGGILMGYDDGR